MMAIVDAGGHILLELTGLRRRVSELAEPITDKQEVATIDPVVDRDIAHKCGHGF